MTSMAADGLLGKEGTMDAAELKKVQGPLKQAYREDAEAP